MSSQQCEPRTVNSGQKVEQSGYYIYVDHVIKNDLKCFVAPKARLGLYLIKGSIAPRLGSCLHDVKWQLDV